MGPSICSASDAAWNTSRIWKDSNENGVTDSREQLTMSALQIVSPMDMLMPQGFFAH